MQTSEHAGPPADVITVRAGCALAYTVDRPTPILLLLHPRPHAGQVLLEERTWAGNGAPCMMVRDSHGNLLRRTMLLPGINEYRHDALFRVPGVPGNRGLQTTPAPIERLPLHVLRYTLPSRYCESDRLAPFATATFGALPRGIEQLEAIRAWTHASIEYRYGSGDGTLSACDILQRGYGVCRDFAHVVIALCRALDLPARYVAGYLPYRGVPEGDVGVDFHAWCEVFLGGGWHTCDARYDGPRSGRVRIAHGMDAVDAAFATIYGDAALAAFQVWAYEVDRRHARLDDPVAVLRGDNGGIGERRADPAPATQP